MKKFTWESFRSEPIAVLCCTNEDAKEFLQFCKKFGFKWDSGAKINPDKTFHDVHRANTCYIARSDFPRIQYRSLDWVIEHGYIVHGSDTAIEDLFLDAKKSHMRRIADSDCERVDSDVPLGVARDSAVPAFRWRDVVTDKPRVSGEYVVVIRWIADGVFYTGKHIAMYDAELEKWGDIEDCEVITHWLDGVPPIPEVVVR